MRRSRTAGFGLVELLVTIAIVAILVALAFPSFEGSMRSNRLSTTTNELLASVSLARTEAIRNTRGGGICASSDGTDCDTNDWNLGWLVWEDGVAGDPGSFDAGNDAIVRVVGAHPRLVLSVANSAGTAVNQVGFDSRGRPITGSLPPVAFSLQTDTCPSGQELLRTLSINLSGQMTNTPGDCP